MARKVKQAPAAPLKTFVGVATAQAYYNDRRIRVGETVHFKGVECPSWLELPEQPDTDEPAEGEEGFLE